MERGFSGSLNVMINDSCNLKCSYCFALGVMERNRENDMSLDEFQYVVDYHVRWGIRGIKIVGGEPTLHPKFPAMLDILAESDQIDSVFIYTNLLCEQPVLDGIIALSRNKAVDLLVNLNPEEDIGARRFRTIVGNLEHLKLLKVLGKSRVGFAIGINVYRQDFDYAYALELCKKLQCNLRYSYVTPLDLAGTGNRDYFQGAAAFAVQLAEDAFRENVFAYIDCNYVPVCCYTEEQYRVIRRKSSFSRTTCPLPTPLSIKAGLTVIPCFVLEGLAAVKLDSALSPARMAAEIVDQLTSRVEEVLFEECRDCQLRKYQGASCGCPGFRNRVSPAA